MLRNVIPLSARTGERRGCEEVGRLLGRSLQATSFISGLGVRFVGVALPRQVEMQGGVAERKKRQFLPSPLSASARKPDLKALLCKADN